MMLTQLVTRLGQVFRPSDPEREDRVREVCAEIAQSDPESIQAESHQFSGAGTVLESRFSLSLSGGRTLKAHQQIVTAAVTVPTCVIIHGASLDGESFGGEESERIVNAFRAALKG